MSTRNLTDSVINRLRQAEEKAVDEVRSRAGELAHEVDELDAQQAAVIADQRRAAVVARLRRQMAEDELAGINEAREELDEEAGQIDYILNGTQPEDEVILTPSDEPDIPDFVNQPVPPPPEPEPLVPSDDRPSWSASEDGTAPQPVVTTRPAHHDPRSWRGLAWVLAAFGALIGFVVGMITKGFDDFEGTGHGWFTFMWVVACILTGLFAGGYIGSHIEDAQERRQ